MFGCKYRAWGFSVGLAVLSACGGSVVQGDGKGGAGGAGAEAGVAAGSGGRVSGGAGGRAGGPPVGGFAAAGSGPDDPPPVSTGCPEAELPPPDNSCDPFAPDSCGPGLGCYPYVDHPNGSGCDAQVYGTQCVPTGSGTQGSRCGGGADFCAAGFVCVVGLVAGKRCAKLCRLGEPDQCTGGFICGELDVAGFGVCG